MNFCSRPNNTRTKPIAQTDETKYSQTACMDECLFELLVNHADIIIGRQAESPALHEDLLCFRLCAHPW